MTIALLPRPGLDDPEALIVHRGEVAYVVLNLYPTTLVTCWRVPTGTSGLHPARRHRIDGVLSLLPGRR